MDEKLALRRRIGAYAFAVWEMTLYLDTHPTCPAALAKRRELMEEQCRLTDEYEAQYGPLVLTSRDAVGEHHWDWVDGPWPWENGKGCN